MPGRKCREIAPLERPRKAGTAPAQCSHCTQWDTKSILPWPRGGGTHVADPACQYLLQNDAGNTQHSLHSQDVPDLLPTGLFFACDFPRRNMEALHTLYKHTKPSEHFPFWICTTPSQWLYILHLNMNFADSA